MPIRVAPKTATTRALIRPALCFVIMLVFQVEECFDIFCRYDFLVNAFRNSQMSVHLDIELHC